MQPGKIVKLNMQPGRRDPTAREVFASLARDCDALLLTAGRGPGGAVRFAAVVPLRSAVFAATPQPGTRLEARLMGGASSLQFPSLDAAHAEMGPLAERGALGANLRALLAEKEAAPPQRREPGEADAPRGRPRRV